MLKRLLGKGARGPEAVFLSLCRGLSKIGEQFEVNRVLNSQIETACVLSGKKTLRWALELKRKGLIKKIVVGPNITMTPMDDRGLMSSEEIDTIVQPSQWVVDFWASVNPELKSKLASWPAGVKENRILRNPQGKVLVFRKDAPDELFAEVIHELHAQGLLCKVFSYSSEGNSFQAALENTNFVIYLNTSESQGLALQESWMADIPTLVWNRGFFAAKGYRWESSVIAAPYLTEQAGMFFSENENFKEVLRVFQSKLNGFAARKYVLENLTDEICAQKYLDIVHAKKNS